MMKTNAFIALWAIITIPVFALNEAWHDPKACEDAYTISCGTSLNDITNSGYPNKLDNYDCVGEAFASGYNGSERIFKLRVDVKETYTFRIDDVEDPEVNFDLFLMSASCEAGNCLYSSTNTSNKADVIEATLEPGEYYLIVDTWANEFDSFDLSVSCTPLPDPVVCYGAYRIPCGEIVTSNTLNGENTYNSTNYNCITGTASYDGPDDVYSFYKSNSSDRVQIHMFTQEEDLRLILVNKCDNDGFNCVLTGGSFNGGRYIDEDYFGLPKGEYYIIVDGRTASSGGSYELVVTCGSGFEDAEPIDCDQIWTGESLGEGTDNMAVYDCGSKNGFRVGLVAEERLYSFSLRRERTITVRVKDTGEADGIEAFLYDGIPSNRECAAIGDHINGEIIITKTLGPGDYTVVVDGERKGEFEIELIGCDCKVDDILICDTPIMTSTENGDDDIHLIAGECQAWPLETDAEDRVFEFVAPESQNYLFRMTDMTADLDLFILEDCSNPYSCLGSSTKRTDEYVTVFLEEGQLVYAIVDSRSRLVWSDFTIAVSCGDDSDGDGVPDDEDNCILLANNDQLDTDGDGEGDVCDDDDDGDNVPDLIDCEPLNANGTFAIGDACDDDNPMTENDQITPACECEGTPVSNDNPIQLSIENGSGSTGDIVCVDIIATEFENVASASFSITIDSEVADIVSVSNLGLAGGSFTGSTSSLGAMTGSGGSMTGSGSSVGGFVVWSASPGEMLTLGPITPIVEVCVEINNNNIDKGTLSINDAIKDVEFFNINADPIDVVLGEGTICRDESNRQMRTVSGLVMDPSEKMLSGVEMALSGAMDNTTITESDGAYAFSVPTNENYEVTPKMLDESKEEVTLMDVLIFRKHFVFANSFTHPFQYVAADIDGSGGLSVRDELLMQNIILGLDDGTYPAWTFVKSDYDFGNIEPFTFDGEVFEYPRNASFENIESDIQQDFVAVRLGDLNADYMSSTRSTFDHTLIVNDQWVQKGELISIPIHSKEKNTLAGLAFYLESDVHIKAVSTKNDALTPMFGTHPQFGQVIALFAEQSNLLVSDNAEVTEITIQAQSSGRLSDLMQLASDQQSQWINEDLEVGELKLEFLNAHVDLSIAAFPNPASTSTTFKIQSPNEYPQAQLRIYDISGKQIQSIPFPIEKGENRLSWNKSEVGYETGMLIYELQAGQSVLKGKLMIVE